MKSELKRQQQQKRPEDRKNENTSVCFLLVGSVNVQDALYTTPN